MTNRIFAWLMIVILLAACGKDETSVNKFSDPVLVKIYDWKDKRLSDSLYRYFSDENPAYRKEAVLAFASIQDTTAVDRLGKILLMDQDTTVRQAAIFAIGQTPSSHSERILLGALAKEKEGLIMHDLFEAYGKRTTHWQLVQPDLLHDTSTSIGFSWSIYRAGLNGKTDPSINDEAALLLNTKYNDHTRLGAAHFFARGAKDIDAHSDILIKSAQNDPSPDVRMACAQALRKIKSETSLNAIDKILQSEKDYRVRINALRALQPYTLEETKGFLFPALMDKNPNVGIAASEVIKAKVSKEQWIELSNLTGRVQHWRIQADLYEAALKASDNKSLTDEIINACKLSNNSYQKAALITALQQSVRSHDFIADQLLKADTPIVRSSAASALVEINKRENFDPKLKKQFADIYKKAVEAGDAAVIGTIAGALADSSLNYKNIITDISFLRDAKNKLSLPRDNEALQPLEAAIAYFEGKKSPEVKNEYNNPIDWKLVKTIPANQEAVIKTSRGHIKLRLFVEEAPGSVANFIRLAKQNYFDRKLFHRVVPNFVIQAGCNRGDGWGSEDYSIRSEFSQREYKTGSVGMASAGKDTEGTQWFITHSPTPHLDGRYTIFAEVTEGMAVVERMEVGDTILDVEIVKTAH